MADPTTGIDKTIQLSGPMKREMTAELMQRIHRSLQEFPELSGHTITVGLNRSSQLHGSAEARNMTIRLNPRLKGGVAYATIGHELTHLLQKPGLGIVPYGEEQCDIWTIARSELFLDDVPFYLCGDLWRKRTWKSHASVVRELCLEAIEIRKTNRRYKMWLEQAISVHVRSQEKF
jgi:hypothetical protein